MLMIVLEKKKKRNKITRRLSLLSLPPSIHTKTHTPLRFSHSRCLLLPTGRPPSGQPPTPPLPLGSSNSSYIWEEYKKSKINLVWETKTQRLTNKIWIYHRQACFEVFEGSDCAGCASIEDSL